jgi:hypothetical protein
MGYAVMLAGGVIDWASTKQDDIATSTGEAEYLAAFHVTGEIVFLRDMLAVVQPSLVTEPTVVYCDNTSAISIASVTGSTKRNKHIKIKYHWVREQQLRDKTIQLVHVASRDQRADAMTKALPLPALQHLCAVMGISCVQHE